MKEIRSKNLVLEGTNILPINRGSPIAGLQLFTMENSMEIGDLGVPQLIGNLNNVLPSGNLT